MKKEQLYDVLGELDDKIINEAEAADALDFKSMKVPFYKNVIWLRLATACLVLVIIGAGIRTLIKKGPVIGTPDSGQIGCSNGCNDTEKFNAYSGVTMPLIITGDDGAEVSRKVDYEFSSDLQDDKVKIQDQYQIKNEKDHDITLQLVYPYMVFLNWQAGRYNWRTDDIAVTTTHNSTASTALEIKENDIILSGSSLPDQSEDETILMPEYSWKNQSEVIEADNMIYSADYIKNRQEYLGKKVVVYTVETAENSENYDKDDVVAITFPHTEKSNILLYNMKGYNMTYYNTNETVTTYLYNADDTNSHQIVYIGEDEAQYEANLYTDESCTVKSGSNQINVTRNIMTIDQYVNETAKRYLEEKKQNDNDDSTAISEEIVKAQMVAGFYDQYHSKELDNATKWGYLIPQIEETHIDQRMIYLVKTITIPSDSQSQITYSYHQGPNNDFNGKVWEGCDGYGLVTRLSDGIEYSNQKASIQLPTNRKIEEQNYGFDLDNAIKEVELNKNIQYYYMLISKKR